MITKKIPAEFSQRILMLEAMTVNIRTLESSANPYNKVNQAFKGAGWSWPFYRPY